jgi:SAM-dependent methyltransferase
MTINCACGGLTVPWIDWPDVPLVNALTKPGEPPAPRHPLTIDRCTVCGSARVRDPLPPEALFPPDYPYQSGASRPFVEHVRTFATRLQWEVSRFFGAPKYVLDVGGNDGTLARAVNQHHSDTVRSFYAVTIDPARPEATIQGFFPDATRSSWRSEALHAITAFNVFAHVPDPQAFAEEAYRLLKPNGWFVVEVTEIAAILSGARLDTLYHEHMWYWSRTGLTRLLESVGFVIREVETFPVQGGAIRVWAQKADGPQWVTNESYLLDAAPWQRALDTWDNRISVLTSLVQGGGKWAGYGAAAKGVMFTHAAQLPLVYVVDETPDKQGKCTPHGIPIVPPEHLAVDPPDGVVILAWNYAREIREKLRAFKGRVYVA